MSSTLVIDAVRTPRGAAKPGGALHALTPAELLAQALRALLEHSGADRDAIEDAVIGCVTQTGEQGGNVGKVASLLAGASPYMSAVTINRYCASGLSAVNWAAQQAQNQDALAIGGGVEMMSRVPMFGDAAPHYSDRALAERIGSMPPPWTSDLVATQYGYTRARCDEYAALSQARAAQARRSVAMPSMMAVRDAQGAVLLAQDENIRESSTVEKLATLKTVYEGGAQGMDAWALAREPGLGRIEHVHTAGNAPCMADGAAAVLLGTEAAVRRAGLRPRARILASADAYQQLLERLRGYYVVGYYVPKASRGTLSELTRHEVEVQLRDRDGDLAYPEIVYRPTVDFVRAKNELEIARQQFQTGDIDGTLFAVENAITANPDLAAAVAYRALVYDHLGRTNEALSDVTRATALSPTDIAIRRLAIRLHRKAGEFEIAFYHTMRIAQTGGDVFEVFGEIAADMPFPDDFLQQFEAPRIAVVPGDSEENNLFARAALPKAIRTIRQAIAEAPFLGLVADPSDAAFVAEVADRDIDQDAPRRFRGRIRLFDSNGKEIYEKGLTLDNVDAPNKDADDLKEIVAINPPYLVD